MLLKPSEVQFVELEEEIVDEELTQEDELEGQNGVITGKTILIGGNEAPVYLDFDIDFLSEPIFEDEDEQEFIFGGEPIVIGGDSISHQNYGFDNEEYTSEFNYDSDEAFDDSLYNFDGDLTLDGSDDFLLEPDFADETEIEKSIKDGKALNKNWETAKHTTLIGKVDSQLLGKIKEYRENVHEMSQEKLLDFSSEHGRDRLLYEASQIAEEIEPSKDINQVIIKVDEKIAELVKKYSNQQLNYLKAQREKMLSGVEEEIGSIISEQIDIIKSESEEHIEETVQYYKKKLENDNQMLSTANNIISRREQILDDAYNKSLSVVEEAEVKAGRIIEESARAHDEAESIIAEFDRKGQDIRQEADNEAERIISDANLESARIIQAAEDQHQDIVEAATQDGFSVGYQEGKEEAVKENSELLREATNSLNKLHAAFPIAARQNEEKILKLAHQLSESIVSEKIDSKEELSKRVLNNSIIVISNMEAVKIKVNPSDLDTILPKQEYFKMIIPDVHEFIVIGDNNVAKGACIIHTKSDEIDIPINTQLSILEAVFNEALANEAEYA
jgi:flagellar assembly protein FliH